MFIDYSNIRHPLFTVKKTLITKNYSAAGTPVCQELADDEVLNTTVFCDWILEKIFLHKKDCQILKQAAQGSV